MICSVSEGFSFRFGMLLADFALGLIAIALFAVFFILFFAIVAWSARMTNKGGEE